MWLYFFFDLSLPILDCGQALVEATFIADCGIWRKAFRKRFDIARVFGARKYVLDLDDVRQLDPALSIAHLTRYFLSTRRRHSFTRWGCFAWRDLVPWVSLGTERMAVLKQSLHIVGIEILFVRILEI